MTTVLFPKWLAFALLAIFWWGIFGFLSKVGANGLPPAQMQIMFTAGTTALAIPALGRWKWRTDRNQLGLVYATCTGLLAGIANLWVFAALRTGAASIVVPVTALYPVVSVALALTVLKERMNRVQVMGLVLALAAILILSR